MANNPALPGGPERKGAAPRRSGSRLIAWGGGLLVLGGVAHMIIALADTAPHYAGAWFRGELWGASGLTDMTAANAAFWASFGSFSVPQILLGLTVLWLNRRHVIPPAFIAWTLGAWAVALGIGYPTSWAFGWLVVVLLLAGARRARGQAAAMAE